MRCTKKRERRKRIGEEVLVCCVLIFVAIMASGLVIIHWGAS